MCQSQHDSWLIIIISDLIACDDLQTSATSDLIVETLHSSVHVVKNRINSPIGAEHELYAGITNSRWLNLDNKVYGPVLRRRTADNQ